MTSKPPQHAPALRSGLMTKEGLAEEALRSRPERPPRLTPRKFLAMSESERATYNRARARYHASIVVNTPWLSEILADALELVEANIPLASGIARHAALVDGRPNRGKTTILKEIACEVIRRNRALHPEELTSEGYEHVPAVWIGLPAAASTLALNRCFCEFYNIPHRRHASAEELTQLIERHVPMTGVVAVLIDDIHYLDCTNQSGKRVNDHIKRLMNAIPATFVFAGVDVVEGRLLSEGKVAASWDSRELVTQTSSRLTRWGVGAFSIDNEEGARQWIALLRALEDELVLLKAPRNMLSGALRRYLFERTGGEMGALMQLVRLATFRAIKIGQEKIDRGLLDGIRLSHAVEVQRQRAHRRRRAA